MTERTDTGPAQLAQAAVTLASRAGEAILEVYASDFEVQSKSDDSPLTQADLASQRVIVTGLAELTPDIPVFAEEGRQLPFEQRREWSRLWLVDPLDGTKEFVKRNGEFTVNIALVEEGEPVIGVVHAPVLGVTYYASRAAGARRRDSEGDRAIRVDPGNGRELDVVTSRSHAGEATARFIERLERSYDVSAVSKGSALKMCLVAEGAAQLYPRLGPTMEWDVAAAQCVVEEAGGELVTLAGERLLYNRPDIVNPSFLACYGEPRKWLALLGAA